MIKRQLYLLAVLILLVVALPAAGQAPGPISLQANEADASRFPDVVLAVTARDANGVPLPDLDGDHFEILEAGIAQPRPITNVATAVNPDAQISVVLVIDVSGSMRGQAIVDARNAAVAFLERLGPDDRAAVIAFSTAVNLDELNPDLERDFTTDKAELISLVEGLEASGGTALYDALFKAIRLADRAGLGHRAILLLTDGVDETPGSRIATRDTPVQEAQRANLPIFTIGLGGQIDPGYLELLARTTGGVYQQAPDSAVLDDLFQNVADRLKQQYLISYQSGHDCDGRAHRVEVRLALAARSASDSVMMGPLVNNPGCNVAAVVTPTATPSATPAPTLTAAPTDTPTTAVVTPAPTETAAATPIPDVGGEDDADESPADSGVSPLLLMLIAGVLLVVIFLGARLYANRSGAAGTRTCMNCGYRLTPADTACPQCGSRKFSTGLRR